MDSKAAEIIARREARKKRILENSTNRLGRIRGEPFVENADGKFSQEKLQHTCF